MPAKLLPLSKQVEKSIRSLDARTQIKIRAKLAELPSFPEVSDVIKLAGRVNEWRAKVGQMRIIFETSRGSDGALSVEVLHVGDRKQVYKRDASMTKVRRDVGTAARRNVAAEQVQRMIGENLRAARMRAGLTQAELARRIGRAQTTVSQAESGRIAVSEGYLDDVLKVCRLPRNWGRKHWAADDV